MQALIENIKTSNFRLADEVISAITQQVWVCDNPEAEGFDCSHMAFVYKGRSEHLSRNHSAHASQLRKSVDEFVNSLKTKSPEKCVFYHFSGPGEFNYQIIVDSESQMILGILKTVSKLEVTEERWDELWSGQ